MLLQSHVHNFTTLSLQLIIGILLQFFFLRLLLISFEMFFTFLFVFLMEYLLFIIKVRDVKSEKIHRDIIIFASFFCCNSNNEYLKRKITNQLTVIFLITLYRYKNAVVSCDHEQVTIHYVFLHLLNS